MKVFVTGANGLLGVNTILELLHRGYQVKGLVRDKNKFNFFKHQNLELIEGNLENEKALNDALQDCNFVIHSAALTQQNLTSYNTYQKVNVEGTKRIINAAINNKVKRIIYVSTANTIGYGSLENQGMEGNPMKAPFTESFYALSKMEGQKLVMSKQHQIEVVSVNPTFMIGPYDSKPSSGRIIQMSYGKKIQLYPPGGKNFVHVADVAKGVVNALENAKNGETYLLAGTNLSYRDFFRQLNSISNQKPLMVKLPASLMLFIGSFGNLLRKLGFNTDLSITNMKALCIKNYYSNQKSVSELNLKYQPVENAIRDAVSWFKEQKML